MKHVFIVFFLMLAVSLSSFAYTPIPGDYVKPKSWSGYPFTYANWTDNTGNPNPYNTYFGWVNKRCLVTSVWVAGGQLYAQLNIPGTAYTVTWPVNYVNPNTSAVTDLLVQTI